MRSRSDRASDEVSRSKWHNQLGKKNKGLLQGLSYATRNTRQANKTALHMNFIFVCLFRIHFQLCFGHMLTFIRHIEVYSTFAFLDCVRYNEDFVHSRFVIIKVCSIHFIVIQTGLKKIVRYIEDFVIQRFVISRTSLYRGSLNRGLRYIEVR